MAFPCGAPSEAGTAGPAAHRVVPGSQPTQCNTLGLARGSGPFEPPTGENSPLAPPSPPAAPLSLSHDRGLDGARSDGDQGVWSIPAPRTKGNREHRVPLCRRALEILKEARGLSRSSVARVSERKGQADREHDAVGTAQGVECRGGAARLPVELPGLGGRRKPIILARWRRLPWRTRSAARSRRPTGARTCSSGGAGSWMTGPATWPAGVKGRTGRLIRPDLGSFRWPSRQGPLWRERPPKRGG